MSQAVQVPIPPHMKINQIQDINKQSYLISLGLKVSQQNLQASWDDSEDYTPHLLIQVNLQQGSHIIYEHKFVESISKFVVLAQNSVIVILWEKNKKNISLINLKEKTYKKNICEFNWNEEERQVFFFKQTQLTCICTQVYVDEDPDQGIRMVKLSYFERCKFDKPILEWAYSSQSEPGETLVTGMVHQGNNHSLVVFLRGKEGFESYHFILQDVVLGEGKDEQAQLRTRNIDLSNEIYKNGFCRLWSVGDFKAWMVPEYPSGEEQFTIINLFDQSIRKPNNTHIPRLQYEENIHFLEDFICIINWNAQDLQYSLYFIDLNHQTLEVILNRYVTEGAQIKYEVSRFEENTILEIETLKNGEVVSIKKNRTFLRKQVYLHCLLWIDEDFDDDLLQQTLEVLGCID